MPKAERTGVVATNRKARHNYDILETFEAGVVLHGSEVKSLREAQVQMGEAYAVVDDGDVWIHNVHIERLTLIPLSIYFKDGRAKIELAIARGRQKGDKRRAIAEKDMARDTERALSQRRR
jgi:SsrA-binding protein